MNNFYKIILSLFLLNQLALEARDPVATGNNEPPVIIVSQDSRLSPEAAARLNALQILEAAVSAAFSPNSRTQPARPDTQWPSLPTAESVDSNNNPSSFTPACEITVDR